MKWLKLWWPVPAALVAACGLYWLIDRTMIFGLAPSFALSNVEATTRANWGALGDVFGGLLNPLLTLFTIILLIRTIWISQETLKQTEEALRVSNETLKTTKAQLEVNRAELADSRAEMARSASAQESIAETQAVQSRQNAFFEVYKLYTEAVGESISVSGNVGRGDESPITFILRHALSMNTDDDLVRCLESNIKDHAALGSVVRLCVLAYALSDGDSQLDLMVSAPLDSQWKAIFCLFANFSDQREANLLAEAIREGRLFGDELLRNPRFPDYHGYLSNATRNLNVSYQS
ncbi:hypothetical protein ADIMK_2654 [Marinobacterium lacunae]|uniref:Uncharacterized protein n=1 Tax=Marinobacterium lacunae TaxID=1232683 RepID=A0A081FX75_9GAMM|nr:hypothetical protein [Marinobacterium lacunae]KEA63130.1 hypothetical protein ADIMK_2654 [Marinobacterium lacunae]